MTAFEPSPFDVVEGSRRVWIDRWGPESASGMAVYTAILRSHQLLKEQVDVVMRRHGLTFPRYQVLVIRQSQAVHRNIGGALQVIRN